ncbi:MAG TPA: glycosyltransferase [Polyangiaceae bacterium]|nr:glycosyltransferase [Polyangiaceae bacterium]
MTKEPLLSVLVPTRDRVHTASRVVAELAGLLDDDAEIVVQDCGREGELRRALGELAGDRRVRYAHVAKKLSMVENWNAGLARCRGRYVTVLGDDDGVHRSFGRLARWLEAERAEVFVADSPTSYYWPDFPDAARAGRFAVARHSGDVRHYDPERMVRVACRAFGYRGTVEGLPMLYRGLVRRDKLEQMQRRPGVYVDGVTPDVYARFFLATQVREVLWADFPATFAGGSGSSNAGRFVTPTRGRTHLAEFGRLEWLEIAPVGLQAAIFHAEGLLRALTNAGRPDLVAEIDVARLYSICLAGEPGRRLENLRRYVRASRARGRSPSRGAADLATAFAQGALMRYAPALLPPADGGHEPAPIFRTYENVADIGAAMRCLDEALAAQGLSPPWAPAAAPPRAAHPA